MEEKKFNVQKMCEEIHAQYGTSEMANYHILLMCDKIENRAFKAGRESVVENIPRLLFKESQEGLIADNGIFEFIYHIYKSASVDEPRYAFATTYETPIQWYDTLEEAMDAANEDYKKRIKQALGL